MDVRRIERALREGPTDEPVYVPGSFRGSDATPRPLAFAAFAVAAALVIGIGVGVAFDALRGGGIGSEPPPVLDAADLVGTWSSDEISWQEWVDGLVTRGFQTDEIATFLEHDPFNETVQYELSFTAGEVTIRASYDGAPLVTLSGATYSILEDGRVRFAEDGGACRPTAEMTLEGEQMTFRRVELPNCVLDERIAYTAFFDLVPYGRVGP
jgi:hypothetical protein